MLRSLWHITHGWADDGQCVDGESGGWCGRVHISICLIVIVTSRHFS